MNRLNGRALGGDFMKLGRVDDGIMGKDLEQGDGVNLSKINCVHIQNFQAIKELAQEDRL